MIRPALPSDLPQILNVYQAARAYMAKAGNPNQWGTHFPPSELLKTDIAQGRLFVCAGADGTVHGVFALIFGADPTYETIQNGAWLSDAPYAAIHRIASDGTEHGIFHQCLDYCSSLSPHLRIDTHEQNRAMRHLIEKHGFTRCGIIHTADGSPRIAYERLR